jgi:hypothetical protein
LAAYSYGWRLPENYRILEIFCGSGRKFCHQIVSGAGEGEHPAHPCCSSMPGLPEIAEDFFHPFTQTLTDGMARMPGSATVNGGLPGLAVLGHMRQGIQGA